MKLTIFFDGSFWCGLVEYEESGNVQVLKHIFGPEPKNSEILSFVNCSLLEEIAHVPAVKINKEIKRERRVNPKRLQRLVSREKSKSVYSTKSQEALKKSQEIKKSERLKVSKAKKRAEKQLKFQMKQDKRIQKKKGH